MTTIITGHHDVVSSVASWLPISSTICLCQMGAVGCAVWEKSPPPPHKKGEFWEGNNLNFFWTSITWRQHQVKTSVFSIINYVVCGFQAPHSLTHHLYHHHHHLLPVTIILIRSLLGSVCFFSASFIPSDSTNWDWWWGVRKDFQNRTQKITKDARLGFRVLGLH